MVLVAFLQLLMCNKYFGNNITKNMDFCFSSISGEESVCCSGLLSDANFKLALYVSVMTHCQSEL